MEHSKCDMALRSCLVCLTDLSNTFEYQLKRYSSIHDTVKNRINLV